MLVVVHIFILSSFTEHTSKKRTLFVVRCLRVGKTGSRTARMHDYVSANQLWFTVTEKFGVTDKFRVVFLQTTECERNTHAFYCKKRKESTTFVKVRRGEGYREVSRVELVSDAAVYV